MHCFSFDIETIPDTDFGRQMWQLDDLSDEDVGRAMAFKQLQKTGNDFLPLHQQRIVAISVALRSGDSFRVWSLGDKDADEAELVRRFFDGIERYSPELDKRARPHLKTTNDSYPVDETCVKVKKVWHRAIASDFPFIHAA